MQKLQIVVACLVGGLALAGCSPEEEKKDPEPRITDVGTTIRTNNNSFSTTYSINVSYLAEVKDAQGDDDIVLAEITYPSGGKETIHDTRNGANDDNIDDGLLQSNFYYASTTPDQTAIQTLTLRVVDADGHEASQTFSTSLLESNESSGKSFVYSEEYNGSDKADGYEGLAVAVVSQGGRNNVLTTNQQIDFDLSVNDDRVDAIYVYFCGDFADNVTNYGSTKLIAGTDFSVDGTPRQKTFSWNDVRFQSYPFFSSYDRQGAGVRLYAVSGILSDDGALEEQPVFSSVTACEPLLRD